MSHVFSSFFGLSDRLAANSLELRINQLVVVVIINKVFVI